MKCELCEIEIEQPNVDTDVRDYLGNGYAAIQIKFKCDRCNSVIAQTTIGASLSTSAIDLKNCIRITGERYADSKELITYVDVDRKRSFRIV